MSAVRNWASRSSIWVFNGGSSSLKFGIYLGGRGRADRLAEGEVENLGAGGRARVSVTSTVRKVLVDEAIRAGDVSSALKPISKMLLAQGFEPPVGIGHRIVHGGERLLAHCLIDSKVMRALDAAKSLAPLHVPGSLAAIRQAQSVFPHATQVACFDTAFHARLPEEASALAVPARWRKEGIRRFGFHGLSCESVLRAIGRPLPRRLVVAHLGSGSSVTAVLRGRSIDTTMGLTPGGGLVMGTRSGDLDPGVLFYAMRRYRLTAAQIEHLLEKEAGLAGLSNGISDVRELHSRAARDADAALALKIYADRVAKAILAAICTLGGVDQLVFTGGIGERDARMRIAILKKLQALPWREGMEPKASVVPARENDVMARHVARLL